MTRSEVGRKLLSRETNNGRRWMAQAPAAIVKEPFDNDSQESLLNKRLLPGNLKDTDF